MPDSGAKPSREAAILTRLSNDEWPGKLGTVRWDRFCQDVRTDCGGFIGDPKDENYKRGFSDGQIKRVTYELMKKSPRRQA